ncbi:MAG: chemotaxis response regulator protein-glutamate methylesterase [Planctomycetaceae bacterium]|nr:chemotaxis response regulator protein-glutamate methylesterase [Planctomycetaceae bacterium]
MASVRVLIVDDSPVVRNVLTRELSKDPSIEVIGTAPDAFVARDKIVALKPDVITLDIEMPKMDGITFLRKLMEWYPIPVIIVSGLTPKGCSLSLEALEIGAVDVIEKPALTNERELADFSTRLIDQVKAASLVRFRKGPARAAAHRPAPQLGAPKPAGRTLGRRTNKIVAIGASTGGTEALKAVLERMPVDCPPIMIVQHMPGTFTKAFAERLNRQTPIEVLEAEDGMEVKTGRAIIANGNVHLLIRKGAGKWQAETREGPLVCRHKPSVEVLFNSFAKHIGSNAIGVMLTGMGRDGADAMKNMRDAGARNVAQDEKSCVVFGMPKEAIKAGAVEKIVPLDMVTDTVLSLL